MMYGDASTYDSSFPRQNINYLFHKILHIIQHSPHPIGTNSKLLYKMQDFTFFKRLSRFILVFHATIFPNTRLLINQSCKTYNNDA
ncbi:hypothetical protein P40081_19045 [Paenibacillus sp. FSL P4-0081]|nr:hypothetical protein P40081_19045 [Paenibacillus sp. FSL P4-0081]